VSQRPATGKIRALVVDDEPLARSNLTVLLRHDAEVEVIGECGSGMEALKAIRSQKPDLVFLDVQMPECDGFDVLELLGGDIPLAVVFVTAYDEYALRAFEAGALDYLLKPFQTGRFVQALARAKARIVRHQEMPAGMDRLAIKSAGRVSFIKSAEIDWVEAADYYACLHVGTKSHLLRRSMNDLARDLDGTMFCRVHRSAIVNLDRVREIRVGSDGEDRVVLEDNTQLRLSRRYRKQLQSRLRGHTAS
jgi:two-component system, LytTR family, response regulator